ncbi:hypothetical protein F4225_11360 [Candidatus Poribacteria bacterium]|nr:hypothetical protein [Candidatus Poribacteria bacterium]
MANGNFKQNSQIGQHLKDILLAASSSDPKSYFDLEITPNPKHEAAAGLVETKTILEVSITEFDFLAGEVFTENGEDKAGTELLTVERLGKELRLGDRLIEMETFIDKFNAGLGKTLNLTISLSATLKRKLIGGLNDGLSNLAKKPDNERIVEPLFILVLKNLLKRETENWK